MRKFIPILIILLSSLQAYSNDPLTIIRKLDRDAVYNSIHYSGEIQIEISGRRFVKRFTAYARGSDNSFIEFTNQEDLGTKYLKLNGNLFMYSPDVEDIIPITGHMLKESMMGSDMSYEDTINNDTLESQYNGVITGEEVIDGKLCWILELTAKRNTVTYPKQRLWVDQAGMNLLKIQRFALSGVLLKEETVIRTQRIGNRDFPVEVLIRDMLRRNSSTRFIMHSIELDIEIPAGTFSMRNLKN